MSLRVRLLLALAYVLLLALVALEVPLGLSLRRRVDDEVRSQARAQADVLAATASDLLAPARRGELQALLDAIGRHGARARDRRRRPGAPARRQRRDRPARALLPPAPRDRAPRCAGAATRARATAARSAQDLLATAVPIRSATRPPAVGAVRITQSVSAVHRAVRRTIVGLARIGLLVLAIGLVAGLVIAARSPARCAASTRRRAASRRATSTRAPRSRAAPSSARSRGRSTR